MNKQCKACGSSVPNEARFCQVCGGSEFLTEQPAQPSVANNTVVTNNTVVMPSVDNGKDLFDATMVMDAPYGQNNYKANQPNQQPVVNQCEPQPVVNQCEPQPVVNQYNPQPVVNQYNQQPQTNQGWQPAPPQNQAPKKKTGLIIGIVAAALVVLAGIGIIAEKAFQKEGYGDSGYSDDLFDYDEAAQENDEFLDGEIIEEPEAIEYTKGTFDGSVYINEWANIKMALPSGYSNADSATYATMENDVTECGAYFIADDTMGFINICYEKLPAFSNYDEEKYMDAIMDGFDSVTEVEYTTTNEYTATQIAGQTYCKAECDVKNDYGEFVNTVCVRKVGDYIVFISAGGIDAKANNALMNTISVAN